MKLYMFRTIPLSIIRSGICHMTYTTQQLYMSYRFVDSFRARPGWNSVPCCWVYSEWTPDDGHRNCPKHVEFHAKNKFAKLVHLVGLIIKKQITVRHKTAQDKTKWCNSSKTATNNYSYSPMKRNLNKKHSSRPNRNQQARSICTS